MKHGKKYVDSAKLLNKSNLYEVAEALDLVIKTGKAKFDETVELHVRLGVDGRHADQQVRGAVVLPNGTGKNVRALVFCKEDKVQTALDAGADFAGSDELIQKITAGWMDFDVVIATPDMMGVVGRLGKVLGPRGLMPNPKAGKIEYRLDKTNIIHCPIGKVSFGAEKLQENFEALLGAIVRAKPAAAKGQYVRSCTVASTMGPGVHINPVKVS